LGSFRDKLDEVSKKAAYCKGCEKDYQKELYKKPHVKARRAEYMRKYLRVRNSGVTEEQVQQRLVDQEYKCAICGEPIDIHAPVDHDHKTGEKRGLLCHNCNLGLGKFRDNVAFLERAIQYLTRGSWKTSIKFV